MKKKESIQEGYYPMGKKASYSDSVPSVKMIIQHSRQIEEGEQRYRNVERIFLENEQGERFLAPTTKPGIARVYARHIAEGGNPHDDRWNHIGSLCEEYQKMGAFVRATRNGQFNESTQRLVTEGINHYEKLRENLTKLAGHRGYNAYFESYTPPLMEDEGSIDLSEMFMSSSLDPRIESVMPILAKLSKNLNEMSEVSELSEWADSLIEGGGGGEASEEPVEPIVSEEESLTSNNPVGIPENEDDLDEGLDIEKKQRLKDLIDQYRDATDPEAYYGLNDEYPDSEEVIAQIRQEFGDRTADSIANGPSMHFPRPGHSMGHDDLEFKQMHKNRSPNRITKTGKLHKQDSDAMKRDIKNKFEVEEGILDTLKKVGGKVLDKLGHEDDVLKDLQKKAGIPSHAQHGKPNMAHPKDEERIEEVDMGQADSSLRNQSKQNNDKMDHFTALNKASKKMGHDHYMDVPDDKLEALKAMVKRFRAGEEVDESALQAYLGDKKYGKDGMDKLRQAGRDNASEKTMQNIRAKYSNKEEVAEKFDPLKHIDKDKAGKKGTLTKARMDRMKMSSPYSMRGGPKGVLPEGQEDLDTIRRLLGK